jgi:hypothetical protein
MTELTVSASAPGLADLRIEPGLPMVVSPRAGADITLAEAAPLLHTIVAEWLERAGGVRFTGFRVESIEAFQRCAASFGDPLIGYEFASTPRSQVEGGVHVDGVPAASLDSAAQRAVVHPRMADAHLVPLRAGRPFWRGDADRRQPRRV